jgi:hypothetical protein
LQTSPDAEVDIKFIHNKPGQGSLEEAAKSASKPGCKIKAGFIYGGKLIIRTASKDLEDNVNGPRLVSECRAILAKWIEPDNQANV